MSDPLATLSFEVFWDWLLRHPNCILRAGTLDTVLYDDDDLHWHFAVDGAVYFVQVIRGKRLLGEIAVEVERVAYTQPQGEDREGEFLFELVSENETERVAAYFFVLSHGYDEAESSGPEHAVH
ncbi:MAG: hypothetical protein ACE5EG_12770 [Thermoanaerobaculia bacterium]